MLIDLLDLMRPYLFLSPLFNTTEDYLHSLPLRFGERRALHLPKEALVHVPGPEEVWPEFQKAKRSFNCERIASLNSLLRSVISARERELVVSRVKFPASFGPCVIRAPARAARSEGIVYTRSEALDLSTALKDLAL